MYTNLQNWFSLFSFVRSDAVFTNFVQILFFNILYKALRVKIKIVFFFFKVCSLIFSEHFSFWLHSFRKIYNKFKHSKFYCNKHLTYQIDVKRTWQFVFVRLPWFKASNVYYAIINVSSIYVLLTYITL